MLCACLCESKDRPLNLKYRFLGANILLAECRSDRYLTSETKKFNPTPPPFQLDGPSANSAEIFTPCHEAEVTSGKVSAFWGGGFRIRNPTIPQRSAVYGAFFALNPWRRGKRLPVGVEVWRGVPAQVSSSSSNRGSNDEVRPKIIALVLLQKGTLIYSKQPL
ncbi:hypothetical protein AVEN_195021-1 [Araneus ventricosus]|uniref:Uncharacterized protein n=1 Tax=Araneus ventricosus TaxID=182803 RepID=A0A4Y2SL32_ARAVE|nr:hypothetical protein AVEN_195021-1 [Araneus ventricosus]